MLVDSMGREEEEGVVRGQRWEFLAQQSSTYTGAGLTKLVEQNFL